MKNKKPTQFRIKYFFEGEGEVIVQAKNAKEDRIREMADEVELSDEFIKENE